MFPVHVLSLRGHRPAAPAALALLLPLALAACGSNSAVKASSAQEAPAATTGSSTADPDSAAPDVVPSTAPAVATVGEAAPDFELTDTAGRKHKLADYVADGKLVVLEWFNPDCPIAKAYHVPQNQMAELAGSFADKDVVWLAINSGADGKQGAGLERNQRAVDEYGITYPVLLDMSGDVGHRYEAKTTPHMYVIDTAGVLRYAGAIDNGDPRNKGDVNLVKQALEEILAGKPVTTTSSEPFGCSVKYGS
ncbi:MAG: thioredoxin family protein [Planctomycetota bacterium]|jgi:peroxiredoxin